ncbi:Trihelix transcription factor GT-3b [Morella rubra]|uniref:Trihelix transcription factor GT-3b n=1 Tax=Morella rubra TaxID=262757 RepID=A0A6A1VU48_9ROSI|nr:Trihelix transcription factor GT-3b [Morella rubra]
MFGGGGDGEGLSRVGMMTSATLLTADRKPPVERGGPQAAMQPQWSQQETREFIGIWAEVEMEMDLGTTNTNTFNNSKRTKTTTLWEVVSTRMREKGYKRTPEQCKCKWKNLLSRYKLVQEKEESDPENGRLCPFFGELHAIFNERARNTPRVLLESEAGSTQVQRSLKKLTGERSLDEFSDNEDEDEDDSRGEKPSRSNSKRRKVERDKFSRANNTGNASSSNNSGIQELLKGFFHQQHMMEIQWREMMDRCVQDRLLFEQEWQQKMVMLEKERVMAEQAWREKEEQRKMREETRAERRDALLTTLLNKIIHEDNL